MRFACPSCKTRYNIPDDKVPPAKSLRLTCKKCSNVIRVRRKAAPSRQRSPARGQAPQLDAGGDDPCQESTRVASLHEIRAMQNASASATATTETARAAGDPDEWYVLVAGQREGPIKASEILAMLAKRVIDKRTYTWRDGMAKWMRMATVPDFQDAAAQAGDADWRVMTVVHKASSAAKPSSQFSASTVAMDASQLHEQLEKTRNSTDLGLSAFDEATKVADPDLLVALAGEPTGETISRGDGEAASKPGFDALMRFEHKGADPARAEQMLGAALDRVDYAELRDDPSARGSMPLADSGEDFDPSYLTAPPGEETRVFMATAGIYRRRRQQNMASVAAAVVALALTTFIVMDVTGYIVLPGMGAFYDYAGMVDPNIDRAVERVQEKLQDEKLTEQERLALEERRKALQAALLGGTEEEPQGRRESRRGKRQKRKRPTAETGIEEKETLNDTERSIAMDIFSDDRKQDTRIQLADPSAIRTPNLPKGLTQKAIYEVIVENNRSMKLCVTEALRKGEKISGKMEVQLTIGATGAVSDVQILTGRFRNSTIGSCAVKRVGSWRFPRFNGEPVAVVFPYVLSAGF